MTLEAVVQEEHAPTRAEALRARRGERLRLGRRDEEWPGWIWCVAASGVGSWVPEPFVEVQGEWATLQRDYDATELTASAGERLLLHEEVLGWWWAITESGAKGWIPAAKVAIID